MTPTPQPDNAHPFAPFLQPGEELLWVGRPNAEAYVIKQSQKTVLAFWWGTVLLFVFSAFSWTGNHGLAVMATVVSLITWWIVFALPFFKRKQNTKWQRIHYAISNHRVMLLDNSDENPFLALQFKHINRIVLEANANGIGTIICRPPPLLPIHEEVYETINGAREVCELIRTSAQCNIPIVEKH